MQTQPVENTSFNWKAFEDDHSYRAWRATKLTNAENCLSLPPVEVGDLSNPTESEHREIIARCQNNNFALYSSPSFNDDSAQRRALRRFADAFGMRIAETHRSGGDHGIVALRVSDAPSQRDYIPYSTRAMNWHTDGYYNAPENRISGFALHCFAQGADGGTNDILDPEILYIRLRDKNPEWLAALMHPQAMSIPENVEADGAVRRVSNGPVFYPDPDTGRMQMRYTARTRSINWRNDPATLAAEAWLRDTLAQGDPLAVRVRLAPGMGVLNNNVLHNRTPFHNGPDAAQERVIFRVRFHNRIGEK
ncbi:TauD/TfdA family dioxygenase [Rhodobacteraceae bacterium LMO-12]|nr:TauD/TfdA family dioxygenase [Rhodobacteraceae bacterium LMO-JJ12]